MEYTEIINTLNTDDPKKLALVDGKNKDLQIQIETDHNECYINLSEEEVNNLRNVLSVWIDSKSKNIIKTYDINFTLYKDHTTSISKINNGFNIMESLGIMDILKKDLFDHLDGVVKPNTIHRIYIEQE